MTCDNDPSIEQMRKDLLGGGWRDSISGTMWTDLLGRSFRGPHKAWHIWHGGTEEWLKVEGER